MATTIMGGLFVATFPDSYRTCRAFALWFRKGLKESGRGEEAASAISMRGMHARQFRLLKRLIIEH